GNHSLAEIRIRYANHRRLVHPWQGINDELNLLGINIVSTRNNEILAASHNAEVCVRHTLSTEKPQVTSAEPTISRELFPGLFRHAPVTGKHVGAAHLDTAD